MTRRILAPDGWVQGRALARLRAMKKCTVYVNYYWMRHVLTDMLVEYMSQGTGFGPSDAQVARGVFAVVGNVELVYDDAQQ